MGLSVLEAANTGVKYLDPDSKPGLFFALLSLFRVLRPVAQL
jgi:hypothetical protein